MPIDPSTTSPPAPLRREIRSLLDFADCHFEPAQPSGDAAPGVRYLRISHGIGNTRRHCCRQQRRCGRAVGHWPAVGRMSPLGLMPSNAYPQDCQRACSRRHPLPEGTGGRGRTPYEPPISPRKRINARAACGGLRSTRRYSRPSSVRVTILRSFISRRSNAGSSKR